jgi:hypothetical protein
MDDVRKKIGITAAWDTFEEIAYLDIDAVRQTAPLNQSGRVTNEMRQVKKDSPRAGIVNR